MRRVEKDVLDMLKPGLNQKEISNELARKKVRPCSISSVEKIINELKTKYKANSLFQLGMFAEKLKL